MSWLQFALALLKLANYFLDLAREKQQMDAGADRAIAAESVSILQKTNVAKEEMAKATGMTEEQVDATLKGLEP